MQRDDCGTPQRVLVVGSTGAGKTTAGRRIAERIGAPFHELDTLAFGPDWSTPPEFVETVHRILIEPAWVFDSHGYDEVIDSMWAAADTVVWLDYPARVVLPRVVRRSLYRSISRVEVFGGNRETWRGWLDREHPVWWSAGQFRKRRAYLAQRTHSPSAGHLRVIRLRTRGEFERWLVARRPAAG